MNPTSLKLLTAGTIPAAKSTLIPQRVVTKSICRICQQRIASDNGKCCICNQKESDFLEGYIEATKNQRRWEGD